MSSSHEHTNGGHERSDAQARPIASSLLAIAVLVGVAMAAMGGLFAYWAEREAAADPGVSPIAEERVVPPEPRLQPNPMVELDEFLAEEDARLNGYGWIDEQNRIVYIPVEKAMALAAERGVPVRLGEREVSGNRP
jgi:hypothetical protein